MPLCDARVTAVHPLHNAKVIMDEMTSTEY